MKRLSYQKLLELLSFVLRCPVCSNKYNAEQTSVIEGKEIDKFEGSPMMVHTDCEFCKSSVVFNITLDGPEILSIGMITDLTSNDAKKFRDNRQITSDEVIEFHKFVREFDGDFEKALRITN